MSSTAEQIGVYGFVNGLGLRGDPQAKARLLRSVRRAIRRGDWDWVLKLAAAYGIGVSIGSWIQQAARPQLTQLAGNSQW
jgi:hypothetical protein